MTTPQTGIRRAAVTRRSSRAREVPYVGHDRTVIFRPTAVTWQACRPGSRSGRAGRGSAGAGRVTGEQVRQFLRAAQRDAVASDDLIRDDAKPLGDHPAHEPSREEAVLGAQDEPRRYRGPGAERPRAAARRVRLRPTPLGHGLLGQVTGNVMVEGDERITVAGLAAVSRSLLGNGLPPAGIGGPVLGLLSGSR